MQRAKVSNHPCHRLSVPAAKRFWCRHCMMVFEDAITRWRHSRSCRSGGFDNFIRRREIETQALQKMAETLDPDMTLGSVPLPSGEAVAGCSKELCCFICRQRFMSLDEMREHVKYPCNKPANLPRPSMTVYIEEPTFGTGIQQHFTDGPNVRSNTASSGHHETNVETSGSPHPVAVYMSESEDAHAQGEAKPTNIYVNEKGETVIEVENLDLNTKSGELSLAHLLTQLSQQGIVFDQQASGPDNNMSQGEPIIQGALQEVDLSQPTAVDAANTLTQLAGSAFRASGHSQTDEIYTYTPPAKRIKSECIEVQYPSEQVNPVVETEFSKDGGQVSEAQNYIICTNESEVISVVRADNMEHDQSHDNATIDQSVYQGSSFTSAGSAVSEVSNQGFSTALCPAASQDSVGQQTFSENGPTPQTVVVEQANQTFESIKEGHQADEYAVCTPTKITSALGQLEVEQLEDTGSQMIGNRAASTSVAHYDTVQLQVTGCGSRQPDGVCKVSRSSEDSVPVVPDSFGVGCPTRSSQLESSVDTQPSFMLPQIASVTVPEIPVTTLQESPSAGMFLTDKGMSHYSYSYHPPSQNNCPSVAASSSKGQELMTGPQSTQRSDFSLEPCTIQSRHHGKVIETANRGARVTCKQGNMYMQSTEPKAKVMGQRDRRVTRSVSLEMAKQKARVLRSHSLPDRAASHSRLPKLVSVLKEKPSRVSRSYGAKPLSIKSQIEQVRKGKRICKFQRSSRSLHENSNANSFTRMSPGESKYDGPTCSPAVMNERSPEKTSNKGIQDACECFDDFPRSESSSSYESSVKISHGSVHRNVVDVPSKGHVQNDSLDQQASYTKASITEDVFNPKMWLEGAASKRLTMLTRLNKKKSCKCMACGRTFSSHQLLLKHRRVPCCVQHTRMMSQNVLRPRPVTRQKSVCKPRFRIRNRMKPKLLIAPIVLHEHLKREKRKRGQDSIQFKHGKGLFQENSEPQICLQNKRLVVSCLDAQEQFLFHLGLLKTDHMTQDALVRHQALLRSKIAIHRLRQEEANLQQTSFTVRLSQNIVICSESCPLSPDGYGSPPVLERIDFHAVKEDSFQCSLDPPLLVCMVDDTSGDLTNKESVSTGCADEVRNKTRGVHWKSTRECVSKDSQQVSANKINPALSDFSKGLRNPVVRITIKSVSSSDRLGEGGEIIVKSPDCRDRILIINPDRDVEDTSFMNFLQTFPAGPAGSASCEQSVSNSLTTTVLKAECSSFQNGVSGCINCCSTPHTDYENTLHDCLSCRYCNTRRCIPFNQQFQEKSEYETSCQHATLVGKKLFSFKVT